MVYVREVLLERRQKTPKVSALWDMLSLTQRFASSSLTQCGYELTYIRQSSAGSVAILLRDKNVATICSEGYINTTPDLTIRP